MTPYETSTWALELPDGWTGQDDGDCHTFLPSGAHGAFQVSAYLKEKAPVSDEDLHEFAGTVPTREAVAGDFTGIHTRFSADDAYWMKWWLRSGHTMIHATFNCSDNARNSDAEESALKIVNSLKSKKINPTDSSSEHPPVGTPDADSASRASVAPTAGCR